MTTTMMNAKKSGIFCKHCEFVELALQQTILCNGLHLEFQVIAWNLSLDGITLKSFGAV
jgi:hypothetical protein